MVAATPVEIAPLILPRFNGPRVTPALDTTWDPPWIDSDRAAEWYWFAREYGRCYRYYFLCAEHRLASLIAGYGRIAEELRRRVETREQETFQVGLATRDVEILYWDFDAFLAGVNSSLDLMARIVGAGYRDQLPPSFNRLCGKDLPGLAAILRQAQSRWVRRMKDYRDCLVHYTPVDTLLAVSATLGAQGKWEIRAKLPINPNARDILSFRYRKRTELMRYAVATYRNLLALDRRVADSIRLSYRRQEFPVRTTNLFFIGRRDRS